MSSSNLKNVKYWQERGERNILAGEKTAEEMLRDLTKHYKQALKAIQSEIERFRGKYMTDVGVSYEEAQKALSRKETKDYITQTMEYYEAIEKTGYAFDPAYRSRLHRQLSLKSAVSRLDALQNAVQWEIEKLYAEHQESFTLGLSGTYEEIYYSTIYNIQQGIGFGSPFTVLNVAAINKAVKEKWIGDNYSDRIWEHKDRLTIALEQIIPQGVILGHNPRKIAKAITKKLDVAYSNAERLARTEFMHIAHKATFEGYNQTGIERYQIIVSLDERTCETCGPMDGKVFNVKDEKEAVNAPVFHSNCRRDTIPYFPPDEADALFEEATRIARDPDTGKNYYVPADMTYNEWKKKFVDGNGDNTSVLENGTSGNNKKYDRVILTSNKIKNDGDKYDFNYEKKSSSVGWSNIIGVSPETSASLNAIHTDLNAHMIDNHTEKIYLLNRSKSSDIISQIGASVDEVK